MEGPYADNKMCVSVQIMVSTARINRPGARAASVKHKYYASFTVKYYLNAAPNLIRKQVVAIHSPNRLIK